MNEIIVPMDNKIRVKMKKRQLEICSSYLASTKRSHANAKYYDLAVQMQQMLPADIERFEELAKLDAVIGAWGNDGPTVIKMGGTGETLNDMVKKYLDSFIKQPTMPMLREQTIMYLELYIGELEEKIKNNKDKKEVEALVNKITEVRSVLISVMVIG